MAHVITEPCVGVRDRSCVAACPVDCIVELDDRLAIDPSRCIDCGACIPACPVSAIYPGDQVPGEWIAFVPRDGDLADAGRPTAAAVLPPPAASR